MHTSKIRRVTCARTINQVPMSSQLVTSMPTLVAATVQTPHPLRTSKPRPSTITSESNQTRSFSMSSTKCSRTAKTSSFEWRSSSRCRAMGRQVTQTRSASLQIPAKRWPKIRGIQIPKSHSHLCKSGVFPRPAAIKWRTMDLASTCSHRATASRSSHMQTIPCLITLKPIVWISQIRASTKHLAKFWIHWTMIMLISVDRRQPITIFLMPYRRRSRSTWWPCSKPRFKPSVQQVRLTAVIRKPWACLPTWCSQKIWALHNSKVPKEEAPYKPWAATRTPPAPRCTSNSKESHCNRVKWRRRSRSTLSKWHSWATRTT